MQVSKLSKNQILSILKVALYIGVSSVISYFITFLTNNPEFFGPLTGLINVALVTVRKFFVTEE